MPDPAPLSMQSSSDCARGRTGPVIAIVGPTASGKSALADAVAVRLRTRVISADAMQVYKGMDVGTAKTPVDERLVPLELVDIVDPDEDYSAALFQRDARVCIEEDLARGCVPVLCGGTGLYVRAALDDMHFPKGQIDDSARNRYQALAERLGPQGFHDVLAKRDPESASLIHPNNVRRTIRALEMLDDGTRYADQHAAFSHIRPYYEALYFGLKLDRKRLYERIDRRVDAMMQNGLLDEVRALASSGFTDALTSRQAIGYKELLDYLSGSLTLEEAIKLIKLRSRRYAKRQISWFGRDDRIVWLDMDELDLDAAASFVLTKLEEHVALCSSSGPLVATVGEDAIG